MASYNQFFVVRDMTLLGDCVEVATGVIPGTSPAFFTSLEPTAGTYKLVKCPVGGTHPQGATVSELLIGEAQLVVQGDLFTAGSPTADFIAMEQEMSQVIRRSFMAAQASLSVAAGEALFTVLEPASHALSAGSLTLAYFRFNASSVDASTKAAFNPLFEDFFTKFPRDLT